MPTPFQKGEDRIESVAVSNPALDSGTAGEVAISIDELVSIEEVVSVFVDVQSGAAAPATDAILEDATISGNTVTLSLEEADGSAATNTGVDEIVLTARGV